MLLIIAVATFAALLWIHAYVPHKLNASDDVEKDPVTNALSFVAGIVAALGIQLWMIYAWTFQFGNPLERAPGWNEWLGFTLVLSGAGMRYWAIKTLGSFFTLQICLRNDHRLITSGPYRYLLHPSYTGAILGILGFCLFFFQPTPSLIYFCGLIAFYVKRIQSEEKMLTEKFGNTYLERRNRCYRLIPFIY